MANSFRLEIVSAEEEIYSGRAYKLFVTGELGELEILPGHAHFLTSLKPGPVWIVKEEDNKFVEEALFISGGMLEVQPDYVTVLADTAIRAKDVDEAAALEAEKRAKQAMLGMKEGQFDYQAAHAELATALAQLRIIRKLREGK